MALTATVYHWEVTLSDLDRGVYESLDLRLPRHPSETLRYLVTRTLAYCLCYEPGIRFSKGGLSSTDEPPVSVRSPDGVMLAWIDVGAPSADRLHKAAKAAARVDLFTHVPLAQLQREAATRAIHKAEQIRVFRLSPTFLDALEAGLGRTTSLEIVRTDGQLYVTIGGNVTEGTLERCSLVEHLRHG